LLLFYSLLTHKGYKDTFYTDGYIPVFNPYTPHTDLGAMEEGQSQALA